MRRRVLFFLTAFLSLAGIASADPQDGHQPSGISDRPSVGLFLGSASNGDSTRGGGSGGEADFVFDAPITPRKRVRFDATKTSWYGVDDGFEGIVAADRITLTTLRISLITVVHGSRSLVGYHGFGLGAYRYDYAHKALTHPWQAGVHYILGLEFPQHSGRSAIDAEFRIHAIGGPESPPESQALVFKMDGAIGMKLRF